MTNTNSKLQNQGGGDAIYLTPQYLLQDMEINFFDFKFVMNFDWTLKETKLWETVLDPAIWSSLFLIKEKYFEKATKLKKRTKIFEEKQKNYLEKQETREKNKAHLQEHIKKSESKLSEYKNVILAFWKLATCNSITK